MTRACHLAVRSATGDVFSDAEIDDFLDRIASQARRARQDAPTLDEKAAIAEAAGAVTKAALREALIAQRLKLAADTARDFRRGQIDAMPAGMNGAKRLEAINVGSERQGLATSASVDAEGRARQMRLWGQVETGLDQMPGLKDRLSNFFGFSDNGVDRLVAREMARLTGDGSVEPTGDAGALHAARVFVAALEAGRTMQNEVGAWIDRLPGYVARQAHDAGKIAGGYWRELGEVGRRVQASGLKGFDWNAARAAAEARAFGEWRDFIRPKLDAAKTFGELVGADVDNDQLNNAKLLAQRGIIRDHTDLAELMLHKIWTDIVTRRHDELSGGDDLGDFKPKASLARSVSKARVLHFQSPDAWMDYAAKYGRGGLFGTVMSQLERAGRNAALMRMWGPAPQAAFDAEVSRLTDEARARGDVAGANSLKKTMVKARFEAINGQASTPDNLRLAQVMQTLRGWEALTKLGSIVLSKATDLPITAGVFKRVGGTWLEGYRAAFFGGLLHLQSADAKAAAEALDVGARSFSGHLGAQFLASDGPPGWTGWATRLMYKINGFEALNNSIRHGAAAGYAKLLGREAEKDWAGLNIGTRETFERFGITAEEWEQARRGLEPAADGETYFTLDHLDAAPDLRLKFAAMIHNVLDDVVSEPRARERSGMTRGTRPGTIMGEFDRSFLQFKGFINTILGRHLVPAARGYAGVSPAALLAHFIIGTTLAGYVSMNAKMMARGQLPRGPLGQDAGDTAKTWGAALAQGGGLGLYGDFLFGSLNRMGREFTFTQLGGPILADAEQVGTIVQQAIAGGDVSESTGRSPIPAEALKLGATNLPLVNLWYTRLAIDYLVLWRLQEAVSPGYLQRYEARVKNQEHSGFLLAPTSAQ